MARLELARPKSHAPQTCVSTNSTTSAWPAKKAEIDFTSYSSGFYGLIRN